MKKCIIFDCDGVLVNSEWVSSEIEAMAYTSIGFPLTQEECTQIFAGASFEELIKILQERHIQVPSDFFEQLHKNILIHYRKCLKPLIPKIVQQVDLLKIPHCIASNGVRERVIFALKITHLYRYFSNESIFTAIEVSHGKPAPDLFLYAAQKMGFSPENCIVIEDSERGIEGSLNANMDTIGYLGGEHAQYEWYQNKILNYPIAIAKNEKILWQILQKKLSDD